MQTRKKIAQITRSTQRFYNHRGCSDSELTLHARAGAGALIATCNTTNHHSPFISRKFWLLGLWPVQVNAMPTGHARGRSVAAKQHQEVVYCYRWR